MDNVFTHRENLKKAVSVAVDVLASKGYKVPIKQRDRREPKRIEKLKLERRLQDIFVRRFRAQLTALRPVIESQMKAKIPKLPDIPDEEDYLDELINALITGAQGGIDLFSESIVIGFDFTKPNARAEKWAREYAYELIKGIDETSLSVVQKTISTFIETPGYTIGDIIDALKPTFGDIRSSMIAVTETTRAYAQGQLEAGQELQKEFPEVTVYKTWFTNNDDVVCEDCGPLDGKEVPMDDDFDAGVSEPPYHVNCRCWTEYSTKVGESG